MNKEYTQLQTQPEKMLNYQEEAKAQQALVQHETTWLMNFNSPQTKRSYLNTCRAFIEFHHLDSIEALRRITPFEVIQYRDHLLNVQNHSHRSVKNRLAALSSLFTHLVENQVLAINPVLAVKRPKVNETRGETPAMTERQAKKILALPDTSTLSGARDASILYTLFYTGCRISGLSSMTVGSLYEDLGYTMLKYKNKGGSTQCIEVHPELQVILQQYLDLSDHSQESKSPLFLAVKKGKNEGTALTSRTISRIFSRYRGKAGLQEKYTPHSCRSTAATLALENGASLEDVQRMLGHTRVTTTQSYDHRKTQHKDAASLRLHY